MQALHLTDIIEGGLWETDGRSFEDGTMLAVTRFCGDCVGLGWTVSGQTWGDPHGEQLQCPKCDGMGEHLDHLAEVATHSDGVYQLRKVHPNEVHPFFMGYLSANPYQRVGQAAHNAVDIFFPGLLSALPTELDVFEVEETDDERYLQFWTWVTEKTTPGCPIGLVISEEGAVARW